MRNTTTLSRRHTLRRAALALGLCATLFALTPPRAAPARVKKGDAAAEPVAVAPAAVAPRQMGPASEIGQWGPVEQLDTVPVHISLLPDGRILYWGRDKAPDKWDIGDTCQTYTWHPTTKARVALASKPPTNLFCSGHSFLADGRLLVAGGHVRNPSNPRQEGIGETDVNIFDYRTNLWTPVSPGMTSGRWYPSTVVFANGEVGIFSGYINGLAARNDTPDLFTLSNTIRPFTATSGMAVYPYLHLGPGNRVFIAGSGPFTSQYFDRALNGGNGAFQPGPAFSPQHIEGSAVTYGANPSKVLMVGGRQEFPGGQTNFDAQIIDLTAGGIWQPIAPLNYGRKYHTATVLPDGKVLVAAGTRCNGGNDIGCAEGPARHPELWNPADGPSGTWKQLAANPSGIPRAYHSVALLLPDGRVLVGGGGLPAAAGETVPAEAGGTVNCTISNYFSNPDCRTFGHKDVEIFSPPYLFVPGTSTLAARPRTTSVPTSIIYGQTFTIGKNSGATNIISSVSLIRLPSVTHGFNFDQRRVELAFTSPTSTSLSVTAPVNGRVAPPGHYMLFLVNSAGVPSVASIVRVGAS